MLKVLCAVNVMLKQHVVRTKLTLSMDFCDGTVATYTKATVVKHVKVNYNI